MRLVGASVIACKLMGCQAGMLRTPAIQAGIAQLVEHDLAKVGVASSNLVSRSNLVSLLISFPAARDERRGVIVLVKFVLVAVLKEPESSDPCASIL